MIDQWNFLKNPRVVARFDLIETTTGLLLVAFMWGHMLMLSTILFGPGTMNTLAEFLESPPLYVAQVGVLAMAALILIHLVTAGRKLPARVKEQAVIWRLSKQLRHTDTWLWVIQAVTGMIILMFAAIHLWVIATTFPIQAMKSSTRVAQSYGYLYLPMVLIVELHVGIGLYRAIVKWTSFNRRVGAALKWGITGIFLVIGYSILATFWSYGVS